LLQGEKVSFNDFSISFEFSYAHNNVSWLLTCVYGPCTPEGKLLFLEWMKGIQMPDEVDWMLMGDFNLLRKSEDRNRDGGNLNEMLLFDEAISSLGLNEIVLQGRKFTWTNMQTPPLLAKLDWVFTSSSWNVSFPSTFARALDMAIWCPLIILPALCLFRLGFPKARSLDLKIIGSIVRISMA
jgi:hypothetical protein